MTRSEASPYTEITSGDPARADPACQQLPRGRVNLRKGEFAFTKDLSQLRGRLLRLAAAAAVLLVLGFVLGIARLTSLRSQARAYDDAVCTATRRILGNCLTDYRQAVAQLSGGRSRADGIPRVSGAEVACG